MLFLSRKKKEKYSILTTVRYLYLIIKAVRFPSSTNFLRPFCPPTKLHIARIKLDSYVAAQNFPPFLVVCRVQSGMESQVFVFTSTERSISDTISN
jgi:hypothetical protein